MSEHLQRTIASYFQRRHCVLVGSGTTAIYVILKALALPEHAKVVYPDITCETAVNASVYAGLSPAFRDIELHSFNLDMDETVRRLQDGDIRVLVATHIYGNILDIPLLRERLRDRNIFVLEDAAQAYGGATKVGAMGDASIVSFGPGKLLDCGGGGAILLDADDLHEECLNVVRQMQKNPVPAEHARNEYRKALFTLAKNVTDRSEFRRHRDLLKREHRYGYVFPIRGPVVEALSERFHGIDEIARRRRQRARDLGDILSASPNVLLPRQTGVAAPWRLTFLVKNDAEAFFNTLVERGIHATRYFSPVHRDYGLPDAAYPNSVYLFDRVINIDLEHSGHRWADVTETLGTLPAGSTA